MARAQRPITRIPRTVSAQLRSQVSDLWATRLDISTVPDPAELIYDSEILDPLAIAGTQAMELHEQLEAPQCRARQPRQTLQAIFDLALRKAE